MNMHIPQSEGASRKVGACGYLAAPKHRQRRRVFTSLRGLRTL